MRGSTALEWFTSVHSGDDGACAEVACDWRKSGHSSGEGGGCLEVAAHPSAIHIRDSKTPGAPHHIVTPGAWAAFLPVL